MKSFRELTRDRKNVFISQAFIDGLFNIETIQVRSKSIELKATWTFDNEDLEHGINN